MRLLLSIILAICLTSEAHSQKLTGLRGLRVPVPVSVAFTPTNYLNLYGWWKADTLTNAVNGSEVVYWVDSSGHNLHMQRPSNGPYWTNNFQNALPAAYFDGVNDYMTNACDMMQTNCIFMVIQHRIPDGLAYFLCGSNLAGGNVLNSESMYWGTEAGQNTNASIGVFGASGSFVSASTNIITTYTIQYAMGSSRVYTNGVLSATVDLSASDGSGTLGGLHVGAVPGPADFWRGYMLEMFCLTNTFATQGTVVQDGNNYLRAKWGHY